jgi:hypothetical protein
MDDEKLINLRMNIMTERLPFPVRRLLWMEYYAKNKRTMSHVDFHKLVKTDSKYDKQIRLDVDRTNILGGYFEKDVSKRFILVLKQKQSVSDSDCLLEL